MFFGTYRPKFDEKGRLVLPAKFREQLVDGVVVAPGQERCLVIYPRAEFERIADRMVDASLTSRAARDYQRMVFSNAHEDAPDKQGRITVPNQLRGYAQLKKDVIVIGSRAHVEIWEPASWEAYRAEQEAKFSELDSEIFPGF